MEGLWTLLPPLVVYCSWHVYYLAWYLSLSTLHTLWTSMRVKDGETFTTRAERGC